MPAILRATSCESIRRAAWGAPRRRAWPWPLDARKKPREPPPEPLNRIVMAVRDSLLERNDGVVGDLDVLGADLGAALRDVAIPDPAAVLEVTRAVGPVHRMQLQAGGSDKETRAHERILRLVVAQHVADVLAQEALDALPELLNAVDVLLLPAPVLVRRADRRAERHDLAVHLVIP